MNQVLSKYFGPVNKHSGDNEYEMEFKHKGNPVKMEIIHSGRYPLTAEGILAVDDFIDDFETKIDNFIGKTIGPSLENELSDSLNFLEWVGFYPENMNSDDVFAVLEYRLNDNHEDDVLNVYLTNECELLEAVTEKE